MASRASKYLAAAVAAAAVTGAVEANFVGFAVTSASVANSGVQLTVYNVFAVFDGPTDTLLAAKNFGSTSGINAYHGFYHKDNASYNCGALGQEFGTWNPSQTGSITANRPFDSYLTVGGQASGTNTSNADPSWVTGGNADARSWNRADLPNNSTLGWFNSNVPNLQGRVGTAPNTATNVRIGQFVVGASDATVREFSLTVVYNSGVAGAPQQEATSTFRLCQGQPYYLDADGDGYGSNAGGSTASCVPVNGYVTNNFDCNDSNAAINPTTIWYRDEDGDGIGHAPAGTLIQCVMPAGYALAAGDNCPSISNPTQTDCNSNAIGDVCEIAAGQGDCNSNGTLDVCEVTAGLLTDCDSDTIPDICEGAVIVAQASKLLPVSGTAAAEHTFTSLPRVASGTARVTVEATADLGGTTDGLLVTLDGGNASTFFVADGTDCPATPNVAVITLPLAQANALVADGGLTVRVTAFGAVNSASCPTNGGVRVKLDYLGLPAASDCNGNGLLDSCEVGTGTTPDCNANGRPDSCDIASGVAQDCNSNGRPDSCDIATGASSDLNGNGRPDECSGELVVGGTGFATLQAAHNAAAPGSTIIVGPGVRNETISIGKRLTIRSAAGPAATVIDGKGIDYSLMYFVGATASGSVIDGFTFRNGSVGTEVEFFSGGALAMVQANVTVRNCVFTDNQADYGGAIYGALSSSTIENCIFTGNSAGVFGGAICFEGGSGWAVRNCTFTGNSALGSGGALHALASGGVVEQSTFTGNSAQVSGGAIGWESMNASPVTISSSLLETNSAGAGGALAVVNGVGAFAVQGTRICRNLPTNFLGAVTDLGGNVFSTDCNANGVCDADEIGSGAAPDCNGNGVIDACDISGGAAQDCNGNGRPDTCDLADGSSLDCNANGVPDSCDLAAGTSLDCNANGRPDSCDIATGVSNDVDANGIPDECKPDCDGDGLPDAWELSQGLDADCNGNGTIDRCEIAGNAALDCNGNVVPDACELAANPALDCNGNGRLDSCDIAANALLDCNANGRIDTCELITNPENDCDLDGQIDTCEIAANAGLDKNANGRLDTCELARGDLNLDGVVNAADLAVLLAFWGVPGAPVGDLDGDGVVAGSDLAIMLGNWGTGA